jgi:hypothetical protein
MQVYKRGTAIIDISNGSGITIASDKVFEIDEVAKEKNTFPVGTFPGDLEITEASGRRRTVWRVKYTISKQFTV